MRSTSAGRSERAGRGARELQPQGLLLNSPRPHLLRFMPALNVPLEVIDRMAEQLDALLVRLA